MLLRRHDGVHDDDDGVRGWLKDCVVHLREKKKQKCFNYATQSVSHIRVIFLPDNDALATKANKVIMIAPDMFMFVIIFC